MEEGLHRGHHSKNNYIPLSDIAQFNNEVSKSVHSDNNSC